MAVSETDSRIVASLLGAGIGFVTSVPCKQLAGVLELVDQTPGIQHVPANREDEGMGLCAGAYLGGKRSCIVMQNTALGIVVNALATLIQFYSIPLPMLISCRGSLGEKVACQVAMATHTEAILDQLQIPRYRLSDSAQTRELPDILEHAFMCRKPVAILADKQFWNGAR